MGLGYDLTQMETINRRVSLPLYPTGTRPKGEGLELNPFLGCQVYVRFEGVYGFSPLGDREAYSSVASGRRERAFCPVKLSIG